MKKLSLLIIFLCLPTSLRVFSSESFTAAPAVSGEIPAEQTDTMNKRQVAQVIAEAGFPKQVVPLVTCLAEKESHFQTKAVNTNTNRTHDYGLLQINSVWLKACNTTPAKLINPTENAKCALIIYQTQGLTAWSTYKTFRNTCLAYRVNEFQHEDLLVDAKIITARGEGLM